MKRVFGDGEDYDEFTSKPAKQLAPKQALKQTPKPLAPDPPIVKPVEPTVTSTSVPSAPTVPLVPSAPSQPALKPAADFLQDSERDNSFADIDIWLRKPGLPTSQKPLLVIGATGSGKSTVIEYYAASAGIFLETFDYEYDLEDFLRSTGLRRKGPGILALEDLDTSQKALVKKRCCSGGANGGSSGSKGSGSSRRIILTTCDEFSTSTLAWSKVCTTVRLERPKKFFITKVIAQKWPLIDAEARSMISEACGGNLAVALQSASLGLTCIADMPMDVPKATRVMLMGQTVKCLGGSSDTTYLSQLVHQNMPQCFGSGGPKPTLSMQSLHAMARQMNHISFLDICATTNEFEGEHLWQSLQSIAKTCPPATKFNFEWTRSTKPLEKPKMDYLKWHS
jgi:hypothetical protein